MEADEMFINGSLACLSSKSEDSLDEERGEAEEEAEAEAEEVEEREAEGGGGGGGGEDVFEGCIFVPSRRDQPFTSLARGDFLSFNGIRQSSRKRSFQM